jgi:hypothetical protein
MISPDRRRSFRRLIAITALAAAASCGNPLSPGTEWIIGSWNVTFFCEEWCDGFDDFWGDRALTLTLDGEATLEGDNFATVRTGFRTGIDKSAAGLPHAIWFDRAIFGSPRFAIPSEETNVIRFPISGSAVWILRRMP